MGQRAPRRCGAAIQVNLWAVGAIAKVPAHIACARGLFVQTLLKLRHEKPISSRAL